MSQDERHTSPVSNPLQWTISNVRAEGLPKEKSLFSPRYYYTISINGKEVWRSVDVAKKDAVAVWNEEKRFAAASASVFELKVFIHHPFRKKDKEVGGLKRTMGSFSNVASTEHVDSLIQTGQSTTAPLITLIIKPVADDAPSEQQLESVVRTAVEAVDQMQNVRGHSGLNDTSNAMDTVVNTVSSLEDTWKHLLENLKAFMESMNNVDEIHPYTKVAWRVLASACNLSQDQRDPNEKIKELVDEMKAVYELVIAAKPLKAIGIHKSVLKRLSLQTIDCGHFISSYAKDSKLCVRVLKQAVFGFNAMIDGYVDKFKKLGKEFTTQSAVQTEIMVVRMIENIEGTTTHLVLGDLHYAQGARYQRSRRCLTNTRTNILEDITAWINNAADDTPRIHLLHGPAGTGKSTIARTIAYRFEEMKRLGSSFCFSRDKTNLRPEHLFPTLARGLADFDPVFKTALLNGVGESIDVRMTTDLSEQLERFLLEPGRRLTLSGPIVIVIDGLDEIGDTCTRRELLSLLSTRLFEMPSNFRILLTSRTEEDIIAFFERAERGLVTTKRMPQLSEDPTLSSDIFRYICTQLTDNRGQRFAGLDDRKCQRLKTLSEGLFQWAFVACAYIRGDGRAGETPLERCNILLCQHTPVSIEMVADGQSKDYPLDDLYRLVLSQTLHTERDDKMRNFKATMGFVLTAFEPLSLLSLKGLHTSLLVDRSTDHTLEFSEILPYLGSLLSGVDDESVPIRPLHTSFRDFLTTFSRGGKFYIPASTHHQRLAVSTLRLLNRELRFNICGLKTSYVLNREVLGLDKHVEATILPHVSYACRYWAQHLRHCTSDLQALLALEVKVLLQVKFLFWLEALSLLGAVNIAGPSLSLVISQITLQDCVLADFAKDALKFVRKFGRIISDSAPHLYLSALTCAPTNSIVAEHFRALYPRIPCIWSGNASHWPLQQMVLHGHTQPVMFVAFSQDGKRIASASDDRTVRIWDAETGDAVGAPLEGHTSSVSSVAFSQDGKRIASASDDRTVRIWDAKTERCNVNNESANIDLDMGDGITCLPGNRVGVLATPSNKSHSNTQGHQSNSAPFVALEFSWVPHHRLSQPYMPGNDEQATVYITIEDGWIICNTTDRLLWISPEFSSCLYRHGTTVVIPHMITLDLSRFAHGPNWHECNHPFP